MSGLIQRILDSHTCDMARFRWRTAVVSDETFVRRHYRSALGVEADLENPRTFCEKITWLLLNYRPPDLALLADKYEVRAYVKTRAGGAYLTEMIGLYSSPEIIPFDALPDSFALKATHGCKWNALCADKWRFDRAGTIAKFRRWLRENFYWYGREWVYRNLTPRIICEQYLADENGQPPADIKIFCFSGEPRLIQVDADRFLGHKRGFFTPEWRLLPATMTYPSLDREIPRPHKLSEMLDVARALAAGLPFVRVDLYALRDRILFGELTFLPGRGIEPFSTERDNLEVGSWIKLPPPHPDRGIWSRLASIW